MLIPLVHSPKIWFVRWSCVPWPQIQAEQNPLAKSYSCSVPARPLSELGLNRSISAQPGSFKSGQPAETRPWWSFLVLVSGDSSFWRHRNCRSPLAKLSTASQAENSGSVQKLTRRGAWANKVRKQAMLVGKAWSKMAAQLPRWKNNLVLCNN